MNARALFDNIEALPPERIAEVEDFVDFLRMREDARSLARAFTAISEPAFARVWGSPEDSIYDAV